MDEQPINLPPPGGENEQLVLTATDLAVRAIDLLSAAEEYRALPYLRHAVAILNEEEIQGAPDNKSARNLLRMALVLLDRDCEQDAACGVEIALAALGEPFPELSDLEAEALLDRWESEDRAPGPSSP